MLKGEITAIHSNICPTFFINKGDPVSDPRHFLHEPQYLPKITIKYFLSIKNFLSIFYLSKSILSILSIQQGVLDF